MTTGIVIPAHMGSTRFPGKPLADVGGKPLLSYAVEAARASGLPWTVATSDEEVIEWCDYQASDPGQLLCTETIECRNGTERAAIANQAMKWDRVIVLQCDEPDVTGRMLNKFSEMMVPATLACAMRECDWNNPNTVAVLWCPSKFTAVGQFIRCPHRDERLRRHVGIYLYDASMLAAYAQHPPVPVELSQSLEQIRTMALGMAFHLAICSRPLRSINVPADIEKFTEDARLPVSQS